MASVSNGHSTGGPGGGSSFCTLRDELWMISAVAVSCAVRLSASASRSGGTTTASEGLVSAAGSSRATVSASGACRQRSAEQKI